LAQGDIVDRCEGATGVDQFVCIERGKWLLLSKLCTAIAKAMDLLVESEAQLLLRARSARAPERRKPMLHNASIGLRLHAFAAFLTAPQTRRASSRSGWRRRIPWRSYGHMSRHGERIP
jgi:hypothetical protein